MKESSAPQLKLLFDTCSEVMLALRKLPVPVVAKVRGLATAAGCQLVSSCDLVIATEGSRFATPGVNVGLFCSTPAVAVARSVHPRMALEMLFLGEPISSERAREIGLVNRVVKEEDLDATVDEICTRISSLSGPVMRLGKKTFYNQIGKDIESAYEYTGNQMINNLGMEDCEEGISAFVEKRKPKWD
eukprot:TRINITY_DN2819_c0_g2_i1.p1 TRINITY_DN2819_c0_g2~~TRINITY_DN2819_c0_g2_i1.p1  ORF type:complete len:188 (+),score=44.25 TRINITY_DN2819_c0_g2_i1:416-979(+)